MFRCAPAAGLRLWCDLFRRCRDDATTGLPEDPGPGGGEKQNSRVIWAAWGAWEEEEPVR